MRQGVELKVNYAEYCNTEEVKLIRLFIRSSLLHEENSNVAYHSNAETKSRMSDHELHKTSRSSRSRVLRSSAAISHKNASR